MRRINTEDGRYHAGDPSKGTKGTIVTMDAMNALQEEIAGFIESAGLELDATDDGQLLKALLLILKNLRTVNAYSITALPQQNVGPIVVLEASEVWLWNTSAYFTGYRSPLCGRPLDGHTVAPLISEVDAVGGTLSKTAYAGLWGYAQENGLVIASGSWAAGMHKFVDLGGDNFRIPDLRNQFRRYTGTDADTANARTLGTAQRDADQRLVGQVGSVRNWSISGPFQSVGSPIYFDRAAGQSELFVNSEFDNSRVIRTSSETRPSNAAYAPRIHV